MKYIVGLDEGTTGCKACVFSQHGELISQASREYLSYYPKEGYVEQDIFEIKAHVFDACKEAIEKSKINRGDIASVGFSNQGITMVLLDSEENIVRPKTIGWQDLRHVEIIPELKVKISNEEHYKLSGMPVAAYNTAVLNWLQRHETPLWHNVARICSHQDYFLRQLGAEGYYIDEGSANFLSMLNVNTHEWDQRLLDLYNVKKEQLPTVVHEAGKVVGEVSTEISQATGLPVGCLVCVGGLDTNCCTFASGGIEGGVAVMVVGTAGTYTYISKSPFFDPNKRITVRINPGVRNWQMYSMTNTAASSFRWFRDELCSMEVATGNLMRVDPYRIMTDIASNSVPGANGITALVCMQGAHVRRTNGNARGTFLGISLSTKKADIVHALLEGICFEMYDIMLLTEEIAGTVNNIRLCGGVSKSPFWCQMFADILQRPVELTKEKELGSFGAAMYAGIGAGFFVNCEEAVEKCVRIEKTFYPNANNAHVYQDAFKRWNKAYDILVGNYYAFD
jgi:xylulokinase